MSLKTYTEARARRAGSHLVTGCTGGCHFDTVRCGQGGRGLSLWWPYGLRLPDLVYILSFLFIMNITEMIGISLRIVLRFFHDLMFLLCWEIKNSWFLIPILAFSCDITTRGRGLLATGVAGVLQGFLPIYSAGQSGAHQYSGAGGPCWRLKGPVHPKYVL